MGHVPMVRQELGDAQVSMTNDPVGIHRVMTAHTRPPVRLVTGRGPQSLYKSSIQLCKVC
jgi:hypothetical protein